MTIKRDTAFFSYSRDDSAFALRLAADLKASSAKVWVDQLDITPGQRWDSAVEDALKTSPVLLVLLSPASVKSTNVQDEVALALDEEKTLIPILYRDCEIPFRLRRLQYVDFRQDYRAGLNRLIEILAGQREPAAKVPLEKPRGNAEATPQKTAVANTESFRVAPPKAQSYQWIGWTMVAVLALIGIVVFVMPTRNDNHSPAVPPAGSPVADSSAAGAAKLITTAPKSPPTVVAPVETPPAETKKPAGNGLDQYYVGIHDLRVNRVGDSLKVGSASVTSVDGILHLTGSLHSGSYYLDLSGRVEPVSQRKFLLNGEISGIPDLSFRNAAPQVLRTAGKFMFEATMGRRYWRMYQVNGRDCVCDDGCGNDFCYIDVYFLR